MVVMWYRGTLKSLRDYKGSDITKNYTYNNVTGELVENMTCQMSLSDCAGTTEKKQGLL